MNRPEILAPAGNEESLQAAVRCGADAVYLGASRFNARASAANFDRRQLEEAVRYCHARGVKVYQTLNTIVFDNELLDVAKEIEAACQADVDALIVQDWAVLSLAGEMAPTLPLHASTQLSTHNLDGVKLLEKLGVKRVVVARELSAAEMQTIADGTTLELEAFVHGALCMCISGQCYLSSMIGGRSGNRGMCAQPCRLPFATDRNPHALSLKDMSLLDQVSKLKQAGIGSLKIEGRMKRPEYVAAAVTACRKALEGEEFDFEVLEAVFSRSGFTSGYFDGKIGRHMFGTRTRKDVVSAAPVLRKLTSLYKEERRCIKVQFYMTIQPNTPAVLRVEDADGNTVTVQGEVPQQAITAPTTPEKAKAALQKTGGTPYKVESMEVKIHEGLMMPVSQMNAMRSQALEQLTQLREGLSSHTCHPIPEILAQHEPYKRQNEQMLRVRVAAANQLTDALLEEADRVIVPAKVLGNLPNNLLTGYHEKIIVEMPRAHFDESDQLDSILQKAKQSGITHALAGNIGSIYRAQKAGFSVHGDFSLNIANTLAIKKLEELGLCDLTLSFELENSRIQVLGGQMERGIIAYGYLPLMLTRVSPAGQKVTELTDRLGNSFPVAPEAQGYAVYNHVPLYLANRLSDFAQLDFLTLYFTQESPQQCLDILQKYKTGQVMHGEKTHGLYYRKVL